MIDSTKGIKRIVSLSAAALCMLTSIRIAPMTIQDTDAAGDIMTAFEITENMQLGWNLGNTFDAYVSETKKDENGNKVVTYPENLGLETETTWGNPKTTPELIAAVKAKGFNTIRVPVTWFQHVDKENGYKIDEAWLARVKEVVDCCLDNGLYVILNMHHEETYANRPDLGTAYDEIQPFFTSVWKQLATTFADCDQHLVFECMNEPRAVGTDHEWWGPTQAECDTINKLNADIVKVIRSTESPYKDTRLIMLPSYCASSDTTMMTKNIIPEGDDYLAASVHAYTPYGFTMNSAIEDHSEFTEAYKIELEAVMEGVRKTFADKDIPVVIGEFSSSNFDNIDARVSWAEAYASITKAYGFPCVLWDNNAITNPTDPGECHGYLKRSDNTWYEQSVPVIDKFLEVLADPSIEWGSQRHGIQYDHDDIESGNIIFNEKLDIDASIKDGNCTPGLNATWAELEGGDVAVKFTGDVPVVAVVDGAWDNWTEIQAYDVDEEKGIAYYSAKTIEASWAGDAADIAHLFARTNGKTTIEMISIIGGSEIIDPPVDNTKKFTLDLSARDGSEQVLLVTFTGAPGSAIEGCVGYMGEEWINIDFKDKIGADGKFVFQVSLGSGENAIPAGVTSAEAQIWWCDDEEGTMSGYEIKGLGVPPVPPTPDTKWGDANCDGEVLINDAILILQSIGNPDAYGVNGTDDTHITEQGMKNADCCNNGDGVTTSDAIAVQKFIVGLVTALPIAE